MNYIIDCRNEKCEAHYVQKLAHCPSKCGACGSKLIAVGVQLDALTEEGQLLLVTSITDIVNKYEKRSQE